jgi:hypothetical protein
MRGAWILGWAVLVGCGGSGGTTGLGPPVAPGGELPAGIEAPAAPPVPADRAPVPPIPIGPIATQPDVVVPPAEPTTPPPVVTPPPAVPAPVTPLPPVVAPPSGEPPPVAAPPPAADPELPQLEPELLVLVDAEPPGAGCARGGIRAQAGIDADRDGALAAGELEQARLLCDGTTPESYLLLRTTDPAATAACPGGVTTAQLGADVDGDEDLSDGEVALAFQACAPVRPTVARLAIGATGASPHLTAAGELWFACDGAPGSLCRLTSPAESAPILEADLDADGATDLHVFAGGQPAVAFAGPPEAPIVAIASDGDGDVYFSSSADAVIRKYVQTWDATIEWQLGCAGARLAADGSTLYVGCPDGSLLAWRVSDGAPLELTVTGAPAAPLRHVAAGAGWVYLATDGEVGRFPASGGPYERLVGVGPEALAAGAGGALWLREGASLRFRSANGTIATSAAAADPRELAARGNLLAVRDGSGRVTLVDLRAP